MKYSKLQRVYHSSLLGPGVTLNLDKINLNYIKNVLRRRVGDEIRIFNEDDGEYIARLVAPDLVEVLYKFRDKITKKTRIHLFAAIVKQDKFEMIADFATQLDVDQIIPLITERVQKREINHERLSRIINEATKQSERLDFPSVSGPILLHEVDFSLCEKIYFANENEGAEFQQENISMYKNIALIVGPEGGFTDSEIEFLKKQQNVVSISLGKNVLRSEVAAISILAKIK